MKKHDRKAVLENSSITNESKDAIEDSEQYGVYTEVSDDEADLDVSKYFLAAEVKKGRLNELEWNLFFGSLSKIYYKHLDDDYKFNALLRLTEMVIHHEITKAQALLYAEIFIHSFNRII